MAKERNECRVELVKENGNLVARYMGRVGSSDDTSLEKVVCAEFDLGDLADEAAALMSLAEAALDADESID